MKETWEMNFLDEYKELRKGLFKKHKAHYTGLGSNDCIILFKEDNTRCFEIMFTYIRGILTISGDLGYAVFDWHNPANHILAHLSFTNINYIMEKCVAYDPSDVTCFSPDLAHRELTNILHENNVNLNAHYIDEIPYFESPMERDAWMFENVDTLFEGSCGYDYNIYKVGNHLGERPLLWWIALHKALGILKSKGVFK